MSARYGQCALRGVWTNASRPIVTMVPSPERGVGSKKEGLALYPVITETNALCIYTTELIDNKCEDARSSRHQLSRTADLAVFTV
jgi:hypothetical protein